MAKKVSANRGKLLFLALAVVIAAGPETAGAQSAASVYAQKCAECHGSKGKGDGPAGQIIMPPPSPFSTSLKGKSYSWIESVITQGGPRSASRSA
jgi:mono/diheme cytochrome c family protein